MCEEVMDTKQLTQVSEYRWELPATGNMHVPGVLFASHDLIREMDDKVLEQVRNVATLPGIVKASFAMPDAHWGYGFPIGGVAAFDAEAGGVVSAGGVGFDISCGVRTLRTGLRVDEVMRVQRELADTLFRDIPAGVGSTGKLSLDAADMDAMLCGGAQWAVEKGYGRQDDLDRIEEHGRMKGADPAAVSDFAKRRQRDEMGTLGSGNHYLEVQKVVETYHPAAVAFGIRPGEVVVSIHCGSRGLGHQIGTDFLREMVAEAPAYGLHVQDRELASAPIESPLGQRYLGAMRAAINCALANREIITHLTRQAFAEIFPSLVTKVLGRNGVSLSLGSTRKISACPLWSVRRCGSSRRECDMDSSILIVLSVLAVTVLLLVSEWVRIDVAAILCMLALAWMGVLAPHEALSGFSSNAVIAMMAVMIMGQGVARTGLMDRFSRAVVGLAGTKRTGIVALLSVPVGLVSGLIQNIGSVALFLPGVLDIARREKIAASSLIMPIGFAAILGGTLTMVGSGPLILTNDLLRGANLAPYGLFSVTPVGLALLAVGIGYFALVGRLVLPDAPGRPTPLRPGTAHRRAAPPTRYPLLHDSCRQPVAGQNA
jgi:hypothetical protein